MWGGVAIEGGYRERRRRRGDGRYPVWLGNEDRTSLKQAEIMIKTNSTELCKLHALYVHASALEDIIISSLKK